MKKLKIEIDQAYANVVRVRKCTNKTKKCFDIDPIGTTVALNFGNFETYCESDLFRRIKNGYEGE